MAASCFGITITVDDDGPADYQTIQGAINAAGDGDMVRVAEGHYFENIDFRGKAITLTGTDPNDPNVVENTIIDANNSGIVVSFHSGEGADSILTGFTITRGHAQYGAGICCWGNCSPTISYCTITDNHNDDISESNGAGLYIYSYNSSLIITKCIFSNNTTYRTGGGIYSNGTLLLADCTIIFNTAKYNGGGIGISNSGILLTLINCTISSNTAFDGHGGGIFSNGTLHLIDCTLNANTAAKSNGGGICSDVGALSLANCTVNSNTAKNGGGIHFGGTLLTLNNCTINSNTAKNYAGGIYSYNESYSVIFTLTDCTLNFNTAANGDGGGINANGTLTLSKSTLISNTANSDGGGINSYGGNYSDGTLTLINCIVSSNTANNSGGGICSSSGNLTLIDSAISANAANDGGSIYAKQYQDIFIRHCTFAANGSTSVFGSCISCYEGNGPAEISHNIITGSKGGAGIYMLYADAVIDYNDLWNNPDGDYGGWAWPGEHDISADPLFVGAGYWDENGTPGEGSDDFWVEGDYHLRYDSPCINAGDPGFVPGAGEADMDGEARVRLGRVDMGADEAGSNPADLDEDGRVDMADLTVLATAWLSEPGDSEWDERYDISMPKDNSLDMLDWAVFTKEWLWQAPWAMP